MPVNVLRNDLWNNPPEILNFTFSQPNVVSILFDPMTRLNPPNRRLDPVTSDTSIETFMLHFMIRVHVGRNIDVHAGRRDT